MNEVTETPMYNFNCKGQDSYSMILTGLAFTHISYLEYYHSEDDIMTDVRKLVDDSFNCEDIALNFVASMLTCEGPLLVLGKDKLDHQNARSGISSKPGHIGRRSACMKKFVDMFGYMPLHEVQGYLRRGVQAQQ